MRHSKIPKLLMLFLITIIVTGCFDKNDTTEKDINKQKKVFVFNEKGILQENIDRQIILLGTDPIVVAGYKGVFYKDCVKWSIYTWEEDWDRLYRYFPVQGGNKYLHLWGEEPGDISVEYIPTLGVYSKVYKYYKELDNLPAPIPDTEPIPDPESEPEFICGTGTGQPKVNVEVDFSGSNYHNEFVANNQVASQIATVSTLGQQKLIIIKIHNNGGECLYVGNISLSNKIYFQYFGYDWDENGNFIPRTAIKPNKYREYFILYSPIYGGVHTTDVVIESSDPLTASYKITVKGKTECDPRPCKPNTCIECSLNECSD